MSGGLVNDEPLTRAKSSALSEGGLCKEEVAMDEAGSEILEIELG